MNHEVVVIYFQLSDYRVPGLFGYFGNRLVLGGFGRNRCCDWYSFGGASVVKTRKTTKAKS